MELKKGLKIGNEIIDLIKDNCMKVEIAGSIRRKRPDVKDVDLVILPKEHKKERIVWDLTNKGFKTTKNGVKIVSGIYKDVQVDLNFCTKDTWGITLLFRTGSKFHNIKMAKKAKEMGLKLSLNKGLMKDDEVIASKTEEEIFETLDIDCVEPEKR